MIDPHHCAHLTLFAAYAAMAAVLLEEGEQAHGRCALAAALSYGMLLLS